MTNPKYATRNIYKPDSDFRELIGTILQPYAGLVYGIGVATVSFLLWGLYKPISPMMWILYLVLFS